MSKQSEAKEAQGYDPKPVYRMCSNCKYYASDKSKTSYGYEEEKNVHCSIGNFAIKKQGVCKKHEGHFDELFTEIEKK